MRTNKKNKPEKEKPLRIESAAQAQALSERLPARWSHESELTQRTLIYIARLLEGSQVLNKPLPCAEYLGEVISTKLFRNGFNEVATHLCLYSRDKYLGGPCKDAVRRIIMEELQKAGLE